MTYLLVGNYGVGNAGDEILKEYFLQNFPEVEWRVLSATPEEGELPRFPAGLRSLLSFGWLRTWQAIKKADGLVLGGGSLFTDSESVHACFIWYIQAQFARIARKPYFLTFQGIGPFRTRMGEWYARQVVRDASFISVRDQASADAVKLWKKNTEVIQSFDPSILLLQREKEDKRTNNVFILIPRFSTTVSHRDFEKLCRRLNDFRGDREALILSFQSGDAREADLCKRLAEELSGTVSSCDTLPEASRHLEDAGVVLTMRYHGAVAALSAFVPFVSVRLSKGDKLDELAKRCGCPSITLEELIEWGLPETNWEDVREGLGEIRKGCAEQSAEGEAALREVLNRN